MHLPRKLQLLQIGLPVILAVVFFAVTRLILPASATNLIPPIDFIDIAPTQTGTVTITFVNGYGTYGTDCYDFIPNGLTGAAASYNGNSYYMGNPEGQTATALRLLAGSGNYNIVVDGTGCEDYPDNILSIFTEGVNLTSSSSPLLLENGASMQLNADGTNTFGGDSAGIKVTAGNAITITSSTNGTLNAIGGLGHTLGSIGAAGIGGDGTQGQSAFGDITINGDVQVNASGMGSGIGASNDYNLVNGGIITITDDARVSAVSTYVGAGIGPGECAYGDDNGQLMISGNAYVYAKGNNASEVDSTVYAGDGIGAVYCDTFSQVSITGGTVIAVGGDYDVPDTSTNGGNGISADNINISGGFVFALGTGDSQALNSGSGFDINAPDIAITGGSVFGSNATISSNPVDSHNHLVYPLYIPTTLSPNNANTANSNVDFSTATPSVPYTLHTLTPDQQAWFTTNGVTWPSDITATAWLPADNTLGANNQRLGTPYSNITAGATTTAFADQRPLYPTYTQALNSVANHLYSTIPVTATDPDPIDQTVAAGTAATFSSTVANVAGLNAVYGPLTYQWQSNADSDNWYDLDDSSSYYDGSNTPTLTIHGGLGGIDDSFTGDYRLVVKTPILPANNPYDQAPSTGAAVLLTTSPVTLTIANPYITLDASANVNINLNPATNPLGGVSDNLVVKTDAALGYSLSVSMSGSDNRLGNGNGSYINPTAGTLNDPLALNVNTWGFAMNSSAAIAGNGFDASYTTPTPNAAARFAAIPINTSPLLIRQTGVTNETGDNVTIYYGADADMTRPAGTYTGTVLFTVVAN